MAFGKVCFFVVAIVTVAGLQHRVLAQEDFDDDDPQQWPAGGISPLDSLAFWDSEDPPAEVLDNTEAGRGCCMPKTWTSTLFSEIRIEGGRKKKGRSVRFIEKAYVDENNQRIALDITVPRGPRRNASKISHIMLFRNDTNASGAVFYTFSKTARKCNKRVLKGAQFRPMCLPANSTLFGSFALGAGSGALKSQAWGFIVRDRRTVTLGSVVLTPANCVPVLAAQKVFIRPRMIDDVEEDGDDKRSRVTTFGALYTDFITQVRDPSVFTPPSYCKKADDDVLLFTPDLDFRTLVQRFVTFP